MKGNGIAASDDNLIHQIATSGVKVSNIKCQSGWIRIEYQGEGVLLTSPRSDNLTRRFFITPSVLTTF